MTSTPRLCSTRRPTRSAPTRRARAVAIALAAATLALPACGGGEEDTTSDTRPDIAAETPTGGDANPTTPSGEGAGGGPAPDTSGATASVPEGAVTVTGSLSGVAASPDEEYVLCTLLTTPDGALALEIAASIYEVIANEVPVQLEINDAATGAPVASLGDEVTVVGVEHADPTPVGGESYRCEGVTGYVTVSSIEPAG